MLHREVAQGHVMRMTEGVYRVGALGCIASLAKCMSQSLVPQDVTLVGNRALADVINSGE